MQELNIYKDSPEAMATQDSIHDEREKTQPNIYTVSFFVFPFYILSIYPFPNMNEKLPVIEYLSYLNRSLTKKKVVDH